MSKCPIPWDKTFDKDKKYIWISEKEENTCTDCKSLDGKIFSGDKVPLSCLGFCFTKTSY